MQTIIPSLLLHLCKNHVYVYFISVVLNNNIIPYIFLIKNKKTFYIFHTAQHVGQKRKYIGSKQTSLQLETLMK
jgi:hypothetical protein